MPAAAAWLVGLLCCVRIFACASNGQFTAAGTQADKNDLMEQFVAHGFAAIEAPPLLIKEAEELPAASPLTYDPIAASQTIFFKMVQMFIMMTFIQQLPALSSGLTKKMD